MDKVGFQEQELAWRRKNDTSIQDAPSCLVEDIREVGKEHRQQSRRYYV
jgi:hypothetical protein